jgi:hypothetical protein
LRAFRPPPQTVDTGPTKRRFGPRLMNTRAWTDHFQP